MSTLVHFCHHWSVGGLSAFPWIQACAYIILIHFHITFSLIFSLHLFSAFLYCLIMMTPTCRIRTGFSTVGGRVRNDNKTFVKLEASKKDIQPHTPRSFHSSFKMSPSLYRRLNSIQTQRQKTTTNGCKYCDCGGMVSESTLTDEEIDAIKKVVARAEAMDKVDEIRIGWVPIQLNPLFGRPVWIVQAACVCNCNHWNMYSAQFFGVPALYEKV